MCQTTITSIVNIYALIFYYYGLQNAYGMCPRGCECDDVNVKTMCKSVANLEYVPHTLNPALKQLRLSHNQIRSIKSSLAVYRNLEEFDISSNKLLSLEENNFSDNKKLKVIVLSNNMVADIHNNTFKGLLNVEDLQLNYNLLQQINSYAFQNLVQLRVLNLSHNKISFISQEVFKGLKHLRTLLLRGNQLNLIPSDSLHYVPNLHHLDLGLNLFTNVTDDAFSPLESLEELHLDSCALSVIEPSAFKALKQLLILKIENNMLEDIPSQAFSDIKLLEFLEVGNNTFSTIQNNAFLHLNNLRILSINNAQSLQTIEVEAFNGLENLENLELSHNKLLSYIDSNIFNSLPNLQTLILRSNAFTILNLDNINMKHVLLDVRENPFTCNCSLEWLKNYFLNGINNSLLPSKTQTKLKNDTNDGISYSYTDLLLQASQVKCYSPPAFKDKLITELYGEDFGCFVLDTKIPIIIAIIVGVVLICGVLILFVISCKYKLTGLVKSQWFTAENSTNNSLRNDLNYRKPDFVFIPNIDLNIEENNRLTVNAFEDAVRYPLKMTPMTEL